MMSYLIKEVIYNLTNVPSTYLQIKICFDGRIEYTKLCATCVSCLSPTTVITNATGEMLRVSKL
jgi:hypothetical protein